MEYICFSYIYECSDFGKVGSLFLFCLALSRLLGKKNPAMFTFQGPFGRAFPSASPLAFTEALPNP
jgi:hypothetical protein